MSDEAKFDEALAAERRRRGEQFRRERRERIATQVFASVIANATVVQSEVIEYRSEYAADALLLADALIAELDGEAGDGVA